MPPTASETDHPTDRGTTLRQRVWRHFPAILLGALGGLVLHEAATSLAEQGHASGTPISNAALYPRLLAGLLLGLVALQSVRDLRAAGPVASGEAAPAPGHAGRSLAVALGMVAYVAVLPVLGFLLATPVFVLALMLLLGDRAPATLAALPLAITAGCFAVFQGLFNVNLPRGLFGIALNF
jgi:hypothetical protein